MNNTFYHKFNNGIRLVQRQTSSPVIYCGIMVAAGTRDENNTISGMAHYIEHCVFKGTNKRSARQIIDRIEDIGGEINAYTTKEETTFYAACLSKYFERTLSLIAEMVFTPTFPKKETDKELSVIYDEIESYNDSPSELIYDDFEALIFDKNPLAMPILGTKKTLKSLSAAKVKTFMAQNYTPDRMVIFVQGNLPQNKVLEKVQKIIAQFEVNINDKCIEKSDEIVRKEISKPTETSPKTDTENTFIFKAENRISFTQSDTPIYFKEWKRRTHLNHVIIGGLSYPLGHPKQLPMYLLNNILGGGSMNSKLNLCLRERFGLVYTIESTYTPLSDTGYWCIYFACEPEHTQKCKELLMNELRKLADKPFTDAALRKYKKQLLGQMAVSATNQENNALSMAKLMLYHNVAPTWEQSFEAISRITTEQLQSVAQEMFQPERIFTLQYS